MIPSAGTGLQSHSTTFAGQVSPFQVVSQSNISLHLNSHQPSTFRYFRISLLIDLYCKIVCLIQYLKCIELRCSVYTSPTHVTVSYFTSSSMGNNVNRQQQSRPPDSCRLRVCHESQQHRLHCTTTNLHPSFIYSQDAPCRKTAPPLNVPRSLLDEATHAEPSPRSGGR
ncbi:hypothetical protein P280DRAFT_466632 [Massarina eburnea CBS 473.64]|uniref:Uncharacterized protein n=1 Tax=Massarina eburnea CBS 473.64 TaxID=1395130 RepID=A0A6A6SAX6_9PLEO|nr:hypothetical protein P280DRAFT_466632 [Massarina eburnea CBS 473.64]